MRFKFVFLLHFFLLNLFAPPIAYASNQTKKSVIKVIKKKKTTINLNSKNMHSFLSVKNNQDLRKKLIAIGFKNVEIEKAVSVIRKHIKTTWYDEGAKIEIVYNIQNNQKILVGFSFYGYGVKIICEGFSKMAKINVQKLDKIYSTIKVKYNLNYVAHLGVLPKELKQKIQKFINQVKFCIDSNSECLLLYNIRNYEIVAFKFYSNKIEKTAFLFKGEFYLENNMKLKKNVIKFETPVKGRLTSPFGYRMHPVLRVYKFHSGIDIAAPKNTPIKCASDGIIIAFGKHGKYGNRIEVQHENNIRTLYAHLNGFAKELKIGKKVSKGEVIGYVGTTGLSTGNHLHYEVRVKINGVYKKTDPLKFVLKIESKINSEFQKEFNEFKKNLIRYF